VRVHVICISFRLGSPRLTAPKCLRFHRHPTRDARHVFVHGRRLRHRHFSPNHLANRPSGPCPFRRNVFDAGVSPRRSWATKHNLTSRDPCKDDDRIPPLGFSLIHVLVRRAENQLRRLSLQRLVYCRNRSRTRRVRYRRTYSRRRRRKCTNNFFGTRFEFFL